MDDDIDPDDVPTTDDFMDFTVIGTAPNAAGPITFSPSAQPVFLDPNQSNNTAACTTMVNAPWEPPLEVPASGGGSTGTVGRMAELLNEAFFVGMDYNVVGRRADPGPETPPSLRGVP